MQQFLTVEDISGVKRHIIFSWKHAIIQFVVDKNVSINLLKIIAAKYYGFHA